MKTGGKIEICALIGVLLSAGAMAATPRDEAAADNHPYNAIIERNVFNLHAPPPPLNPEDLIKKTPPPKLTLTGITTILGRKLVFLTMPASKPGTAPESIMLAEGQAQDEVEVKTIDEKAGVVKVMNHGQDETLDFEHDAPKASGPPPGATRFPPPSAPPPNVMSLPRPGNVVRPIRSLQPRGNPFSSNGNGYNNGYNNGNGYGASGYSGSVVGMGSMNSQSQAPLSREEQVALMEVQRMKYEEEGSPLAKLLPPTPVTAELNGGRPPAPPAPQ